MNYNYTALFNKAIQIKSKIETEKEHLNTLKLQKESKLEQMKVEIHKQLVYESAVDYMKSIIDVLSRSHIDHLEKLLNSAVTTIFFDKNFSIEFEISEYRNSNNLTIYLIESKDDGTEIKTDIRDNGFGVKTIIGFILQIYFIIYHKLSKVLFIDEGFSALSDQYIPYLRSLLTSLKEQYGFIFVLVAHDPRFIEIADRTYEVKDGSVKLKKD